MRLTIRLIGVTAIVLTFAVEVGALENHVRIESRTFYPGQTACTVGVFIENAIPIASVALPFEMRSITPGAYLRFESDLNTDFEATLNPDGRIQNSPLGGCNQNPTSWPCASITEREYHAPDVNSCSGPVSHTWNSAAAFIDFVAPDAFLIAAVSTGDPAIGEPVSLPPGSDPPMTGQASAWIIFHAGYTPGQFEIDTCCTAPATHLAFRDSTSTRYIPSFELSTITISCQCPCLNDPNCDGTSTDILDVIETIQVAFHGKSATTDPGCPRQRTDVDCNGVTNVVDAVRVGLVSFAGFDPSVLYCQPCE